MIRLLICDDDLATVHFVANMIEHSFPRKYQISKFQDGRQAKEYLFEIVKGEADILLLDINLQTCNGIEIAKRVRDAFPWIQMIFITGFQEYFQATFQARPVYCIVKPIKQENLIESLRLADENLHYNKHGFLSISGKFGIIHVLTNDIKYIESKGRRVLIHMQTGKVYQAYKKLDEIQLELPIFIRCHKSFLINPGNTYEYKKKQFILSDGTVIPISQSLHKQAVDAYYKYWGDTL